MNGNVSTVAIGEKAEKRAELLAPAGDFASLKAAINCGADAVYFGGKAFNARMNAGNFDDMTKAVRLCHLFGVRAYLTLNTSLKSKEIPAAIEVVEEAKKAEIDAFIITDVALLPIIKSKYPLAQVHASTQMGIHNRYGAKLLADVGFDRVVLSREAAAADIADIKSHCDVDIEVFVQGAMCVGFSGACLLSSILTGNSGNRGHCLQLCRRKYNGYINGADCGSGYLLSPRDNCMLNSTDKLIDAGATSLKIEGRLKRPEYVACAVSEYRKALDGMPCSIETLKRLFNRGDYCEGFENGKNIIFSSVPNHIGVHAGEVVALRKNAAVMKMDKVPDPYDGYKVLHKGTEEGGFSGKLLKKTENGRYELAQAQYAVGDEVRITTDSKLNAELLKKERKIAVDIYAEIVAGKRAELTISIDDVRVSVRSDMPIDEARNRSLTSAEAKERLSKLGDTVFSVGEIDVKTEKAFISVQQLNELRRRAVMEAEAAILNRYTRMPSKPFGKFDYRTQKVDGNFVELSDASKYTVIVAGAAKNVVFNPKVFSVDACLAGYEALKDRGGRVFLKLPILCLSGDIDTVKEASGPFYGLICTNYYGIELAKELKKPYVLDVSMNIMNDSSVFFRNASAVVGSVELSFRELVKGTVLYTYGYLPLMYINACIRQGMGKTCANCGGDVVFRDEKGYYKIDRSVVNGNCVHILKNGIVTDIGKFAYENRKYFDFTSESGDIEQIVTDYMNRDRNSLVSHTCNHLNRGVL